MTRRAVAAAFALAVVALALLASAGPAWAKSFGIESVVTTAQVAPDASMTVTEEVTYDFDGTFNHLTRSFRSGLIGPVEALEGERALAVEQDGSASGSWQWAIPETTGRHTYTFRYRVTDAVRVGRDVAELNWQFIGSDTAVPIGHVDIAIDVPGDGAGVRAWAHGPLNGVVTITGNRVDLTVDRLPANTFVEAHVVVPSDAFTVAPSSGDLLPGILEAEQRDADAANRARADARAAVDRRHALLVATPFVVVVAFVAFVLVWLRWGREPAAPDDIGDYWREVPDDRPAVGRSLLDFGAVDSTAFSATVADLAQRGYLRITEERTDRLIGRDKIGYRFDDLRHDDVDGLTDWERSLLRRLFDGVESSTQDDLTAWARSHQSQAQTWWSDFRKDVRRDVDAAGYLSGSRAVPFLLGLAAVVGVAAFGVVTLANGSLAGIAGLVAAFAIFLLLPLLRQRTVAGARRAAQWQGLRRFLEDFSRLDEAVSGDLILYERYLVAAVALGVADELVRGLAVKVPQVASDPSFATWYVASSAMSGGDGGGLGGLAGFGAFGATLGAATGAFTPQSSGSGSGGGFSGGGGGGGGGGGFGAS